jgi:uncharacterized SAM-binding protein YcdF (DUF218 family)
MAKKLVIAVLFALVVVVGLPLLVSIYLSPQNELQKSDAIVVISGGDTDARVTEGVKLYFQKWAPKIIFSGAAATGDVSNALAMKRIAAKSGVPADDMLIEEESKTTSENAKNVAVILNKENMKSIILVTSPYHQRRANNSFKTALGKDYLIVNHSAKDETWRKKNWWENANARFLTFGEIMKNAYGLIFQ